MTFKVIDEQKISQILISMNNFSVFFFQSRIGNDKFYPKFVWRLALVHFTCQIHVHRTAYIPYSLQHFSRENNFRITVRITETETDSDSDSNNDLKLEAKTFSMIKFNLCRTRSQKVGTLYIIISSLRMCSRAVLFFFFIARNFQINSNWTSLWFRFLVFFKSFSAGGGDGSSINHFTSNHAFHFNSIYSIISIFFICFRIYHPLPKLQLHLFPNLSQYFPFFSPLLVRICLEWKRFCVKIRLQKTHWMKIENDAKRWIFIYIYAQISIGQPEKHRI